MVLRKLLLVSFCVVVWFIVQCLFNLLYYVIGVRNTKKPPIKATKQYFPGDICSYISDES